MNPESLAELQKDLLLLQAIPSNGYGQTIIYFRNGKIEKIGINNEFLVTK